MARARKQSGAPRKGAAPARATKSTSRKTKSSASSDVEVVEEAGGLGIEDGVILGTFLALLLAFILIDKSRGAYGEGMFFTGDQAEELAVEKFEHVQVP
tara:strand:- start:7104 stop:7400 length:297 start_codon:yes stop_codon:yes gene_type:complete